MVFNPRRRLSRCIWFYRKILNWQILKQIPCFLFVLQINFSKWLDKYIFFDGNLIHKGQCVFVCLFAFIKMWKDPEGISSQGGFPVHLKTTFDYHIHLFLTAELRIKQWTSNTCLLSNSISLTRLGNCSKFLATNFLKNVGGSPGLVVKGGDS